MLDDLLKILATIHEVITDAVDPSSRIARVERVKYGKSKALV